MQMVDLVASMTKRATIVSEKITNVLLVPSFATGDNIEGKIIIVSETDDPTAPTTPFPIDASTGVALTDGHGNVYANGVILPVTNNNELNFTLVVDSTVLQAAFTDNPEDFVEAMMEVRVVKDAQEILLLREPTCITRSTVLVGVPQGVTSIIYNTTIATLADLAAYPTISPLIPTLSMLIIVNAGNPASFWQLITGPADSADPTGQVQPDDYNELTNNRHWQKVGGY